MNDGEALLSAVCEYPDDDTPRLIYADWLDDQGQPLKAEFIRLQVELSRRPVIEPCERDGQPVGAPRLYRPQCRCLPCRLRRKEFNILAKYQTDWRNGVLKKSLDDFWDTLLTVSSPRVVPLDQYNENDWLFGVHSVVYRHGFPDSITLTQNAMVKYAEWFSRFPITRVNLMYCEPLDNAGVGTYFGEPPGPADTWYWVKHSYHPPHTRWEIRQELWSPELDQSFSSVRAAKDALSNVCVALIQNSRYPLIG